MLEKTDMPKIRIIYKFYPYNHMEGSQPNGKVGERLWGSHKDLEDHF